MRKNPWNLRHVKKQTPEISLAAVRKHPAVLDYVYEQTLEIVKAALNKDPTTKKYVDKKLFTVVKKSNGKFEVKEKGTKPNKKVTKKTTQKSNNKELATKTLVITGTFDGFTRSELKNYLESLGAKVTGSVSGKTDLLVAGHMAGSKLTKAKELNIPILDESEILAILKDNDIELESDVLVIDGKPLKTQKDIIKYLKSLSLPCIPYKTEYPKKLNITNSFVGPGTPYIPEGFELWDGFVAVMQLNFEEIKGGALGLPDKGIFQFWADKTEEIMDDAYSKYKFVYHEDVSKPHDSSYQFDWGEYPGYPIVADKGVVRLKFYKPKNIMPSTDSPQIPKVLRDAPDFDYYQELLDSSGNFLLGHPHFIQGDYRRSIDTINLIQLDSVRTGHFDIGDAGTFHLFIEKEDLAKRDFSKVQIEWSCY